MNRITLELVFLSAGLVSVAVGAAEIHAVEIAELKLPAPPLTQAIVSTTGLPIVSMAAFETKFCAAPIDARPAIVSADSPKPSFVESSDAGQREQSSIENSESFLPSLSVSTSLIPNLPSPLDAWATPAVHEGGVAFEAIRIIPLGVFSSR
jgi:hypothetical protein